MATDTVVATASTNTVPTLSAQRSVAWLCALIPFLLVALWHAVGVSGHADDDSGQYLMHAQALAQGRSYADIAYIYSRGASGIGPIAAPPGLPITLAVVYKIIGPNLAVMRFVMLCFATVFVLVSALYFARHDNRRLGLGVALLGGLPITIAQGSSQLLTDLPFAALVWAVIYLMDAPERLTVWRILAITILGAAAMMFRAAGIALFPALLVYALLHYRRLGLRPAAPLLIWIAGLSILALVANLGSTVVLTLRPDRIAGWLERTNFGLLNLRDYVPVVFESHLHPFPSPRANDLFHIVTGVIMMIGLVAWIPKAISRFGTIFAFAYGAVLLITPFTQPRYLWPLFPFFVFGLLNGIFVIAQRWAHMVPRRASNSAVVVALVLVPPALAGAIAEPRLRDPMASAEAQYVVRQMKRAALAGPVRVTFYKPRSFGWASGIPTMGPIAGEPECLIAELARQRITHVIVGSENATHKGYLWQLAESRPDLFALMFRTGSFVTYRVGVPSQAELDARQRPCPPRWR